VCDDAAAGKGGDEVTEQLHLLQPANSVIAPPQWTTVVKASIA